MPMKDVPTVTHQQKRTKIVSGKVIHYEDARLKDARDKFMSSLHSSGTVPDKPLSCGVRLIVKWLFPIKTKKKGRVHGMYKLTKPDTDNLQKLLKDCMTEAGYWKDDALVVSEIVEKFWADADKSGIYVCIVSLGSEICS